MRWQRTPDRRAYERSPDPTSGFVFGLATGVVYEIPDNPLHVLVIEIAHRREVYRDL